jgi:predicted enzyme related to lactoylglutathione lyase
VISGVAKVVVPVDDQEAAREFWAERMGFAVTFDQEYGDERWIEVAPADGGGPVLVLSKREGERPEVREHLPHSPVMFTCEDLDETYRQLTERGVRFPTPPQQLQFGPWSLFEDQDGTRYALGQWSR